MGWRHWAMLGLAICIAGCDSTPNQNFTKDLQAAQANSSDPYARLEMSMPRQQSYVRQPHGMELSYSAEAAASFRSVYLGVLDDYSRATGTPHDRLFETCKAAIIAAAAYQSDHAKESSVARTARSEALGSLGNCRRGAKEAGEQGALLARLASAGMVMIGATVVGAGDTEEGLRIWTKGEQLLAQDQPRRAGLGSITIQ